MAPNDWEMEGKGKQLKGKVNEFAGEATGDMSQKYKGKGQQALGKTQENLGEAGRDADRARKD